MLGVAIVARLHLQSMPSTRWLVVGGFAYDMRTILA